MEKPRLLDVVKLKAATTGPGEDDDRTDLTLEAGEKGTIVHEVHRPDEAFVVEFADDNDEAVAFFTLTAEAFDVIWRAATPIEEKVGA